MSTHDHDQWQRRYAAKKLRVATKGECWKCRAPAVADRSMCEEHLAYERIYQLARYHAGKRPPRKQTNEGGNQ